MSDNTTATNLPPSALFIRFVVETRGPIERSTLIETTGLDETTADRNIDRLVDMDILSRSQHIGRGTRTVLHFEG